jgi:hypothetical protein
MILEILETTGDVMDALGGNSAVETITSSKPSAVSNWRSSNSFPANTYVVMTDALRAIGKSAPDSLWGMRTVAESGRPSIAPNAPPSAEPEHTP